jgi:hypothetical protein
MRDHRRRPQLGLEPLESRALLSAGPARAAEVGLLNGTVHGTFFAHTGSPATGTVYSLFGSGKLAGVGPTLLVGGFEKSGFTASKAGGGNLVFEAEAAPGNLFVHLTRTPGPGPGAGTTAASAPARYDFAYTVNHGSGAFRSARGSGTLSIQLQPINTNIHGQPASNPGFFGNATLSFQPRPGAGGR